MSETSPDKSSSDRQVVESSDRSSNPETTTNGAPRTDEENETLDATLMLIGAGTMQVPAIRAANSLGLQTVVLDLNPDAPGMALADFPIEMSTRDFEGCVREARGFEYGNIDGVITVGTDASLSQAAVAEALDLPGIHFNVAEQATNKVKMRRAFQDAGVPQPDFRGVWEKDEARQAADQLGYPLVIKPADNMGGRGVRKLEDPDDLDVGFENAKEMSTRGELIIEEYLEGEEFSTDSLWFDGELVHQVIADRIIEKEPHFVEMGHVLPSQKPEDIQMEILDMAKTAAEGLGITMGAAKGDIKMTEDGPKMVEMAARLSGGFMSGWTYPLATGRSIIRDAIKIALGIKPDCSLNPPIQKVAMETAVVPETGEIREINGLEQLNQMDGVEDVSINFDVGDEVTKPKSNLDKPANIIVTGSTYEEAKQTAEEARNKLTFEVGPPPEITWEEIEQRAREKFQGECVVCNVCDGYACAGQLPGVGGIGKAESFKENLRAFNRWKLNTTTIQSGDPPDLSVNLWGYDLAHPVLAAPVTGAVTNMNGATTEEAYARSVTQGCLSSGSMAMIGDGASPHKYKIGLGVLEEVDGWGIPIFKPRVNPDDVIKRLDAAEEAGIQVAGMDVDAISFVTMNKRGQRTRGYGVEELSTIIDSTSLNFIVKGIMTPDDAERALEAGVDGIVVSNHGGRVLDEQPATLDVLPDVLEVIPGDLPVLIDGGIRSGYDVFKCLALGADAVMIGRPIMIAAVGAEDVGVEFYLDDITDELERACLLTDSPALDQVDESCLRERDFPYKSKR
jgi:isopentenyl diphosphate isomerase/L-lactate dehydrogenase-like FMN-dependent dehydrogenase/biotin carboxylase